MTDAELRPSLGSPASVTVLMVSGSTRAGSTNTALLRLAAHCAPAHVRTASYDGLQSLPHFCPDLDVDPLPAPVAALRAAIESADAVLFCTPEYAGTLPGSFKNLLDWTIGGTCLTGKPVAWINVAADPRRGGGASATLATVLGYVQADIVAEACVHIPVERSEIDSCGQRLPIASTETSNALAAALRSLVSGQASVP